MTVSKEYGVFLPVANGGWIVSRATPVLDGGWPQNRDAALLAEAEGMAAMKAKVLLAEAEGTAKLAEALAKMFPERV